MRACRPLPRADGYSHTLVSKCQCEHLERTRGFDCCCAEFWALRLMSFFFCSRARHRLLFFFAPAPLLVLMSPSSTGLDVVSPRKTTTFRFFAEAIKEEQQRTPICKKAFVPSLREHVESACGLAALASISSPLVCRVHTYIAERASTAKNVIESSTPKRARNGIKSNTRGVLPDLVRSKRCVYFVNPFSSLEILLEIAPRARLLVEPS